MEPVIAAALLILASAPADAAAPGGDAGEPAGLEAVRLDGKDETSSEETVRLPDPDEKKGGRINVRRGRHQNRYKLRERKFGVALQPGWSMLDGNVVSTSFHDGFAFTVRGIAGVSGASQFYLDVGFSQHAMKDPRAMFFRTAVTAASDFSGDLQVWSPALFYAYTLPLGQGFHSRALVVPKFYVGMGWLVTLANGRVTNAGSKGTVVGHGYQPFVQFTPGIGTDVRVLEHAFVGLELRYRITLPTVRPNETKEFALPKVYVFEPALNFQYMFW